MDANTPIESYFNVIVDKHTEIHEEAGWDASSNSDDDPHVVDHEEACLMGLGLRNNYSKLSASVSRRLVNMAVRTEAIQLRLNGENIGVESVDFHDNYAYLLISMNLSKMKVSRECAEFVDLDY